MARGNQRDKAREANQKKMAEQVSALRLSQPCDCFRNTTLTACIGVQKKSNNMSGSEMQREKEKVAQKMREKQAAGEPFQIYYALQAAC